MHYNKPNSTRAYVESNDENDYNNQENENDGLRSLDDNIENNSLLEVNLINTYTNITYNHLHMYISVCDQEYL